MKLLLNRLSGHEGVLACGCMGSAATLCFIEKFHLVDNYRHQLEPFIRIPIRLPLQTPIPPVESSVFEILLFLLVCFGLGFAGSALRHGPARNRRFAVVGITILLGIVGLFIQSFYFRG